MSTMQAVQTRSQQLAVVDIRRDECPVVFSTPGDLDAFKKRFRAARRLIASTPKAADPAIQLTKARNRRGLA